MFVLCSDCTLESILTEQYVLARRANISIMDSNMMPDFERVVILGLLSKDMKEEQAAYENI